MKLAGNAIVNDCRTFVTERITGPTAPGAYLWNDDDGTLHLAWRRNSMAQMCLANLASLEWTARHMRGYEAIVLDVDVLTTLIGPGGLIPESYYGALDRAALGNFKASPRAGRPILEHPTIWDGTQYLSGSITSKLLSDIKYMEWLVRKVSACNFLSDWMIAVDTVRSTQGLEAAHYMLDELAVRTRIYFQNSAPTAAAWAETAKTRIDFESVYAAYSEEGKAVRIERERLSLTTRSMMNQRVWWITGTKWKHIAMRDLGEDDGGGKKANGYYAFDESDTFTRNRVRVRYTTALNASPDKTGFKLAVLESLNSYSALEEDSALMMQREYVEEVGFDIDWNESAMGVIWVLDVVLQDLAGDENMGESWEADVATGVGVSAEQADAIARTKKYYQQVLVDKRKYDDGTIQRQIENIAEAMRLMEESRAAYIADKKEYADILHARSLALFPELEKEVMRRRRRAELARIRQANRDGRISVAGTDEPSPPPSTSAPESESPAPSVSRQESFQEWYEGYESEEAERSTALADRRDAYLSKNPVSWWKATGPSEQGFTVVAAPPPPPPSSSMSD